jgi:hypothetical protein
MATYRVLWLTICVPLGVMGAAVAVLNSPAAVVFLFIVSGAVGSLLSIFLVGDYWDASGMGRFRILVGGALVAGTGAAACIGYASLLGPGTLLLTAGVLGGSPYAVNVCGRWLRSVPTPTSAQLDAVVRGFAYASPDHGRFGRPEPRDLTDEQLCSRWRTIYRTPQRQQVSAVTLIAAVAERQMYLDELERRNASGFAAWLAALCHTSMGTESASRRSTGTS